MKVSILVAVDRNGGIGKNNALPWKLKDDLRLFKQRTMGHHIVFGRKTFDSIGRALPGRRTIIITRQAGLTIEACDVVSSLEQALHLARSRDETECFVCGGSEVYRDAIPCADTAYVSYVNANVDADSFFAIQLLQGWKERSRMHFDKSDSNEYSFDVVELVRP
jgi:dihydrofolate reductase